MSTIARGTDRLRSWRAPRPASGAAEVIVIGAGPAGLATAVLLRRHGMRSVIVDERSEVGGSWADRYDSLRLNTIRWMSDLPGWRMHRRLGRWVGRDDLVGYLRDYAEHHELDTRLNTRVEALHPARAGWRVDVAGATENVDAVVVATGHSQRPIVPPWTGREEFRGRLIHSSSYHRAADHSGRRVLVVGAGSSGGEICVDLVRGGCDVVWSVRSAPQVFPREALGVPTTPFAPVGDALPDRWLDRLGPWIERRIYGRRDYLPAPTRPMMELLAECKEPMTADGIVGAIRAGRVRVVAAVERLDETGAVLADGSHVDADDVIAATGFRTGLEPLVGHLDVLDGDGRPRSAMPMPGLGFVGFRIPFTGTLWAVEDDARRMARRLAGRLG